ncbi:MAG: O-methyltransferase [Taibaiella sp.]|nr:O-methyltransferase [Taibaiella sp.]
MTKVLFLESIAVYAEKYTTPESDALAALNRETNVKIDKAVMLSGHLQGAFLQMFSYALQPKTIIELGTFTGYSAICMAQGLQAGGVLHTIDYNEELADITGKYIEAAGMKDKIIQHTGLAADILPRIDAIPDLVFIDADKVNYGLYYDMLIDKLRPGGFILADNVLYEGDVMLPIEQQSKNARAMHQFNEKIAADERVEQMLLPLRDGIMVIRRK